MKLKKILLSALVAMGCLTASAQNAQPEIEYVFNPHFYVQVQPVGAQYTLGEIKFKDLLSYNAQLAAGYQFTPAWGARLAINAWQSKGGQKFYFADNVASYYDTYKWKYNYVAPTVDLTCNLSNLIAGFNPNRLFNLSVFAGIGANIGWNNKEAAEAQLAILHHPAYGAFAQETQGVLSYLWSGTKCRFVGQFGANADFRINDMLSVGVEVNVNTLSDHYNSKRAGNSDWYFNALLGAKINLGKTYSTRPVERQTMPQIIHRVDTIYVYQKTPAQETARPATAAAQASVEPLRRDIFFTIRATQVVGAENDKVKEVADYLKKYPNAKVQITGYADKGTGNVTINNNLSAKRAKTVADLLKNKYGIDASRITTDSKGHFVQPFAENDKNRVSICIAQ